MSTTHYGPMIPTMLRVNGQYGSSQSNTTILTPTSNATTYIHRIVITSDTAGNMQVSQGNASTSNNLLDLYNVANGGADVVFDPPLKLDDTAIKVTTSAAAKAMIYYVEA